MSMTEKLITQRRVYFPLRWLPRQQALRLGILMLLVWILVALLSPWIAPFDPVAQDASVTLSPPSKNAPCSVKIMREPPLASLISTVASETLKRAPLRAIE